MSKEINFNPSYPEPSTYAYITSRISYFKAIITDKNTNLEKLARNSGISVNTLRKYRLEPDNLDHVNIQTLGKLEIALLPADENKNLLKKLGYTSDDIEKLGLVPDRFEQLITKKAGLKFTKDSQQFNIALLLLTSLFSIYQNDDYLQNIILKSVINNLKYLDVLQKNK